MNLLVHVQSSGTAQHQHLTLFGGQSTYQGQSADLGGFGYPISGSVGNDGNDYTIISGLMDMTTMPLSNPADTPAPAMVSSNGSTTTGVWIDTTNETVYQKSEDTASGDYSKHMMARNGNQWLMSADGGATAQQLTFNWGNVIVAKSRAEEGDVNVFNGKDLSNQTVFQVDDAGNTQIGRDIGSTLTFFGGVQTVMQGVQNTVTTPGASYSQAWAQGISDAVQSLVTGVLNYNLFYEL
jgi:hypothetical protein